MLIVAIAGAAFVWMPKIRRAEAAERLAGTEAEQVDKLWGIAVDSMRGRRPVRAEKALLTILRFDEKNAAAYNRLGILYAKQKKYKEAVECFEIAESLDHNSTSLHNAGLIYLETGEYNKAAIAFEQAIALEGDLPNRFIAYAKTQEKLGNYKQAIDALEQAFELDKSAVTLKKIADMHEAAGDTEGLEETKKRLVALVEERKQTKLLAAQSGKLRGQKLTRAARATKPAKGVKPVKPAKVARMAARPKSTKVAKQTNPRKIAVAKSAKMPRFRKIRGGR